MKHHLGIIEASAALLMMACSHGGDKGASSAESAVDSAYLHTYIERAYAVYAQPNSPQRDEDKYIQALEYALSQAQIAYTDSVRAAEYLRTALKNRPGQIASDFAFETSDHRLLSLHGMMADCLILAFYDPECPHCSETLGLLDSPRTRELISTDSLTILAVYTEGNDSVWRANLPSMPKHWIVAIDRDSIVDREIYDIPAMPMIYVLDADKRVMIKDAPAALFQ